MSRDKTADFSGKVIALTGGASGIGLATSQTLLARGANIAIGDIDAAALDTARKTLVTTPDDEDRILFTKLDVSDRKSVDGWIQAVIGKFGRLDGAANCAGVIGRHHGTRGVEELEDGEWELIMGVNLTGMMYCLRAQLQNMPGPGSIVCVSSVQGSLGFAKHAAYAASKHGILGLVRSAAKEVGSRNIRVNAVTPGSIQTPLMDKRNALEGVEQSYHETPINRVGEPAEVGNLIVWLLSGEATFVTGATYAVDGGWAC
ncbi:hypothetical protein M409DRAFT_63190 [Zasmidium cellare ATCC 36951]|uniref:Uncharacterized protein n=1 Tax=Zasmidium cellare ATCC 36951 TaxID=1080233 RepID=A0A6A6CZK8_ZASCE|nr:uncharacterized protein M409DRAFT_63190 [Zasmidium cellare ATCC 36951]KAF2172531.1 hypothetical protein M409DRAFT_63190 [Zasmidium cellare ATCC 36951]